jgi:hypothetical protein
VWDEVYIECHDCGERVRGPLSPAEVQAVARNPYDCVLYCHSCLTSRQQSRAWLLEGWCD